MILISTGLTTIPTVLILGFIYTFKVFDLVFVMTGGGPVNSTQMLSTYSLQAVV